MIMSEGKFLFSRTPAVGFFPFFIILSTAVLLLRNSSAAGAEGYTYQIDTMRNGMFLQDWLVSGPFPNCDSCRAETFLHDPGSRGYTNKLRISVPALEDPPGIISVLFVIP
jgi:hypothetical protein